MSLLAVQGGATGTGTVTLLAPGTSTNRTLTLPDVTDTVAGIAATQTLTNKTLSTGLVMGASAITSGTAQASTSGTSIDFTGIPSWVKRITVMFEVVSTNGTSNYQIQIGDSGGIETSGYAGNFFLAGPTLQGVANITSGFGVYNDNAGDIISGQATLSLLNSSTNTWVLSGLFGRSSNNYTSISAGSKSLSAVLDRIRITTISGTPTFDAGSINILYE
jgi:hypothetical protein